MARIKDIAELAGVSRGTVDRVLNNRSGVSPQTAEKIKEIAKALDYRPNKAGLALAAQRKRIRSALSCSAGTTHSLTRSVRVCRQRPENWPTTV